MKRNKIINLIAIFIVLFSLTGCEDFLDQPVKGTQELGNYFSNQDESYRALISCYASLSPEDWWENDFFYLVGDICSDDAFKGNSIEGDQQDFGNLARFNINVVYQQKWEEAEPLALEIIESAEYKLFRYADLFLLHAEAAYHNGNEPAARASLNKVRERVGLDAINSSGEQLLIALYDERRLELAMEGPRFYDLKRQRGIRYPDQPRILEVMEDFVQYNLFENDDYDAGNPEGSLFDIHVHMYFPIPLSEIDLSEGVITQNPGY